MTSKNELEGLSRDELVARAERAGVVRPAALTTDELVTALTSDATTTSPRAKGWFGRARDLLTSVIDRGLQGGERRAPTRSSTQRAAPPPLPTVTLAEIYAAQGHWERAIATLDEVIARDPNHKEAVRLREKFIEQNARIVRGSIPPASPETSADGRATESTTPIVPTPEEIAPALVSTAMTDRYEIDEVVAIAVLPTTMYLYWEVRPETAARLRVENPNGHLSVRVLSVTSDEVGPRSERRDFRVDALFGEMFVDDLPPSANVRVAIGWHVAEGTKHAIDALVPIAVGLDLTMPPSAPKAADRVASFTKWKGQSAEETIEEASSTWQLSLTPPTPEEKRFGHAGQSTAMFGVPSTFDVPGLPRPVWLDEGGVRTVVSFSRGTTPGSSDLVRHVHRFDGASEQLRSNF